MKLFILLCMIFCHVVDDYYSQGILASMKQKSWWENNYPDKLYKYDYLMALFMHSFSWSFMIMLSPTVYTMIVGATWYPILYVLNLCVHFYVDNLKANKMKINLIQDQCIHLVQIVVTWVLYFWIY